MMRFKACILGILIAFNIVNAMENGNQNRNIDGRVYFPEQRSQSHSTPNNSNFNFREEHIHTHNYNFGKAKNEESMPERIHDAVEDGVMGGVQQGIAAIVANNIIEVWYYFFPSSDYLAKQKQQKLIMLGLKIQKNELLRKEVRDQIEEVKNIIRDCEDNKGDGNPEMLSTCAETKELLYDLLKQDKELLKTAGQLKKNKRETAAAA